MSTTANQKQIAVSTKQLKIWYILEEMSADQIAVELNSIYGINCSGEQVVALIKERKIQTRNIRRSAPTFVFIDPDNISVVAEALPTEVKTEKSTPSETNESVTKPPFELAGAFSEQAEQDSSDYTAAQHSGIV